MTPFEFVVAPDVPSSVEVIALDATPYSPVAAGDVPLLAAPLPPGSFSWLAPPNLDATGKMVTRMGHAIFGPLAGDVSSATVQGLAFLDNTGAGKLLGIVWLETPHRLAEAGSSVDCVGPVLAVRQ